MVTDVLGQSYSALRHNRRRAALTMLGMAWGIATVVLLLAYGAGFERAIMTVFSSFGSHMIGIFPGRTSLQAGGSKAGTEIRFTLDDLEYIKNEEPMVKRTSPMIDKQEKVSFENRAFDLRVVGVYPAWLQIRRMALAAGRPLSEGDEGSRARVVVIGDEAAKKFFLGADPLGSSLRIGGISFNVIGVLKHKVQDGDENENRMIIIPFSSMGDLKDTHYIQGLFIEYEGMAYVKVAESA